MYQRLMEKNEIISADLKGEKESDAKPQRSSLLMIIKHSSLYFCSFIQTLV